MGDTFLNKCKFKLFYKKKVYNNKCDKKNLLVFRFRKNKFNKFSTYTIKLFIFFSSDDSIEFIQVHYSKKCTYLKILMFFIK